MTRLCVFQLTYYYAKIKTPTLSLQKAQGQEWGTRFIVSSTNLYTSP